MPTKDYTAGPQAIRLPGGNALAAGVYVVRLTVGEQTYSTKVLLP
ncbi:T9SS type A sorting domain-containing protein [Hymenobacter negativus]